VPFVQYSARSQSGGLIKPVASSNAVVNKSLSLTPIQSHNFSMLAAFIDLLWVGLYPHPIVLMATEPTIVSEGCPKGVLDEMAAERTAKSEQVAGVHFFFPTTRSNHLTVQSPMKNLNHGLSR